MIRASVMRHDAHCIAWATATAAMWGVAEDHDLDEPVRLTDEVPVRIRWIEMRGIVTDRHLSMKVTRKGRNAMLRFQTGPGKFFETELPGVGTLSSVIKTVEVTRCC